MRWNSDSLVTVIGLLEFLPNSSMERSLSIAGIVITTVRQLMSYDQLSIETVNIYVIELRQNDILSKSVHITTLEFLS